MGHRLGRLNKAICCILHCTIPLYREAFVLSTPKSLLTLYNQQPLTLESYRMLA